MHDSMSRELYWPHVAHVLYNTIGNRSTCAREGCLQNLKRKLHLFPARKPLQFVPVDMLRPLPHFTKVNQYLVVITNRFAKVTRPIQSGNRTATQVSNVLFESWNIQYGIPTHILTDTGVQITIELLETPCTILGGKYLPTTAYLRRTNEQFERNNRTIVTSLRHYVAENK